MQTKRLIFLKLFNKLKALKIAFPMITFWYTFFCAIYTCEYYFLTKNLCQHFFWRSNHSLTFNCTPPFLCSILPKLLSDFKISNGGLILILKVYKQPYWSVQCERIICKCPLYRRGRQKRNWKIILWLSIKSSRVGKIFCLRCLTQLTPKISNRCYHRNLY